MKKWKNEIEKLWKELEGRSRERERERERKSGNAFGHLHPLRWSLLEFTVDFGMESCDDGIRLHREGTCRGREAVVRRSTHVPFFMYFAMARASLLIVADARILTRSGNSASLNFRC